mmetsp:Transcript_27389/g.79408  ORF Transcript_27389/g.79408 Transcript_27389/m.79408 type:complete len:512 (-) Transcript_27389:745-2280(-)
MPGGILGLDAVDDRLLQHRFHLGRHLLLPVPLQCVLLNDRNHTGSLLAAHHRDPRTRPQESEPRTEGRAAHGVVPRAEAAAADDGELRDGHVADGVDHLRAVLRDAALLVGGADDEACDVVEKHERHPAFAADLHEVRPLDRGLAEQHAVVRQDPHGEALDVRPTADQRGAVLRLELVEARAIRDPSDHLADVVRDVRALWDDAQHALLVVQGRFRHDAALQSRPGIAAGQVFDDLPAHCEGRLLVGREVVTSPGLGGVHQAAAQCLLISILPGRGLDQRRPTKVDGAVALNDYRLIAHGRRVSAASGAHAANDRDLRDAQGGHPGLVVELSAAFHEHRGQISLEREVPPGLLVSSAALRVELGPAAIDQIDARQPVLLGDLLCPQPLPVAYGVGDAALDRRVGPEEEALPAVDDADRAHDASAVHPAAVHLPTGQSREFQDFRPGVDDPVYPLPHQHLPAALVQGPGLLRPASLHDGQPSLQLVAQRLVVLEALGVRGVGRLGLAPNGGR